MPSSTFFRLPPEKQEKLLRAAQSEFARVPFADASINRIIQAADISRGSFYMYFRDKEELVYLSLDACAHTLEQLALDSLEQYGGDPFAALLDLFDRVQAYGRLPERDPAFEGMMWMFQLNYPMNSSHPPAPVRPVPPFPALPLRSTGDCSTCATPTTWGIACTCSAR